MNSLIVINICIEKKSVISALNSLFVCFRSIEDVIFFKLHVNLHHVCFANVFADCNEKRSHRLYGRFVLLIFNEKHSHRLYGGFVLLIFNEKRSHRLYGGFVLLIFNEKRSHRLYGGFVLLIFNEKRSHRLYGGGFVLLIFV